MMMFGTFLYTNLCLLFSTRAGESGELNESDGLNISSNRKTSLWINVIYNMSEKPLMINQLIMNYFIIQ